MIILLIARLVELMLSSSISLICQFFPDLVIVGGKIKVEILLRNCFLESGPKELVKNGDKGKYKLWKKAEFKKHL